VNRLAYRGPAERAGLRVGDVITALDGRPVGAPKLARRGVIAWIRGSTHRVTVRRPGGAQTLAVRVTRRPKAPGYVRLFLTHAPLPDFTLPRVGAPGSVTFSKLRGKVVLVLFWASWCAVCKTVLPLLARLHRRYAAAGLAVVAVSRDARLAPLQGAIAQQRLPFYVAHDRKNGVGKKNRIKIIPSLLFVDRYSVVRDYVQGAAYTYAQLRRTVRRMLRQRRPLAHRAGGLLVGEGAAGCV